MAIDLDDAKLVITANGYKAGTLYSLKPYDGSGDATVTRSTTATRMNSSNLIETVAVNVPRLDYTNTTCPSILVEGQSTNLLHYSDDFANNYWTKTRATITSDSIASPIASVNADKMIPEVISGNHFVRRTTSASNTSFTFSGFFKDGGYDVWLRFTGASFIDRVEYAFNLENGTEIDFIQAGTFTGSRTFVSLADGWYRLIVTINVPSGEANLQNSMFAYNGNVSFTPDGTSGFYIVGAQLEEQSSASSYIPTTNQTVTRNADVIEVTGLTGTSTLTETFEDDTTNVISNPTTYTMSEGRIKKVVRI